MANNPWLVRSRLHNTLLSVYLKVRTQSPDFRRASYHRPMVLLFPDAETASDFQVQHAERVRRSCVIMKSRQTNEEIQTNLSTNVGMVLVEMPNNSTKGHDMDLLAPFELNQLDDDQLLRFSMASYALFCYVWQYQLNPNKNLEIHGVVINPSMEFQDRDFQSDTIIKYLDKMYWK
jgi:hypothetical protein